MARFVGHHVAEQLLEQRLGRELVDEAERGEREALDHDLHAEVGHVPTAVVDDVVEQQLQVRVDRVVARELGVEVLGEHLDVASFVHHLRRRVVLRVDPRNGLDDLGGAEQRALLAVHELAQRPVLRLDAELDPLLLGPLLEGRAREVHAFVEARVVGRVGEHDLLLVDVGLPRQIGLAVPLRRLRLLVQLVERGALPFS